MAETQKEIKPIVVPTYRDKQMKKRGWLYKQKIKRKEQQQIKGESKKKKTRVLSKTSNILPFLDIDDEHILMKDGVMDIYQVESKDLYSYTEEDLNIIIFGHARFYRTYFNPIKLIAMNFPSNTEKQKEYWKRKKDKTDDPLRIKFIDRKLFEFEYLEKERTNREFFLFVYADDKEELQERKKELSRLMQHVFSMKQLPIDKKERVLFMLNNQNTKI